jgi:hypothetical protein
MNNLSLYELVSIKNEMLKKGLNVDKINKIIENTENKYIREINEDVSATGGPSGAVGGSSVGSSGVAMANASISGMGNVVSSQPSSYSGVTTDPGYSAGGGTIGSGDISVPYNTGGKKVFQKIPTRKTDDRFGTNKRRKSKMMGALKTMKKASEMKPSKKLMRFDDFSKDNLMKVTKVKE